MHTLVGNREGQWPLARPGRSWEEITYIRSKVSGHVLDLCSKWGPVAGSCEYSNEPSVA
jgi:hypothetical protein